jgi:hypothetical protein
MSIELKTIGGVDFAVIEVGSKKKTLTLEAALDQARDFANEAAGRVAGAEREAQAMSASLDSLIVEGQPTAEIRAKLADIQARHDAAVADEREHRANLDAIGGAILDGAAAAQAAQAESAIEDAIEQHPVPLLESAEIIASIRDTLSALEANIAGHDHQAQPEAVVEPEAALEGDAA